MQVFNYYLKAFPHEILPVDAVWSWWSCIYQEIFKDIFEENKQGFDGKSWTLTHFIAFEEHKSLLLKSLVEGVVQFAVPGISMVRIGRNSPSQ